MNKEGKVVSVMTISRDITIRKKAEAELIKREKELKEAQRLAKIGSWDWDAENDTIKWSEEYYRIYGLDPAISPPGYVEHLQAYTPESAARLDEVVKKNIETGEPYVIDLELASAGGPGRWITARSETKRDASGRIIGLRGTAQDITERKNIEEEIRKLNMELEKRVADRTARLEEANKELEAFSYSVSHDLRTPLRAIDGFSKILLEEYEGRVDERGKDYLGRVRAATQHMGQLIDDMLNLSRVGRREMIIQDINLSEIVRSVVSDLIAAQPERMVEFIIQDDVKARGDGRLLRIVLENLLGNSWKFTSRHASAKIEFGAQLREGFTEYFVRDDGAGFDMKYAAKMFSAFQRLHTNAEFAGTGIGLATVSRVLRRHGGTIRAESEVEKGASFYFTIP